MSSDEPPGERDRDIPPPPWRDAASGRTPRVPLTRDAIVDAALRVLDRDGMEALSMRKVADELDTGAASLYWHVKNKEELLQLLFERVTLEIALPEPDPSRWQEQLREMAWQSRRLMNSHRDIARISLGRIPSGPNLAVLAEWFFELLRPVGVPDRVIAYLGDVAGLYIGAFAFEESLGFSSPTGEDLPPEQILAMMKDYLLSLPAERFPNIHRAIDLLLSSDQDDRFEFGIELWIRGIASYVDPQAV